jgi:hypothetical protein
VVVGLDWDPLLETQDTPGACGIGKVEKTAQGFRVSVDVKEAKARDVRNPAAQADVAFVGGRWTFVDFVEEPADPKSRQGLMALLKGYERSGECKCGRWPSGGLDGDLCYSTFWAPVGRASWNRGYRSRRACCGPATAPGSRWSCG